MCPLPWVRNKVTSILQLSTVPSLTIKNHCKFFFFLFSLLQIALVHLFFNISGILLWYVLPFMRVPIPIAKSLGHVTAQYRWFAVFYVLLCFFFIPLLVFGLSLAGLPALLAVLVPVLLLIITVLAINFLQSRFPERLPSCLRSWDFLPLWARSLEPWDRIITAMIARCCCCCKCCQVARGDKEAEPIGRKNYGMEIHDNPVLANESEENVKGPPSSVIFNATAL